MEIFTKKLATPSNNIVNLITIKTTSGLYAEFLSLGACIRKIAFYDAFQKEHLLNTCYQNLSDYESCQEYAGMTIGPNAGRISDATIIINKHPLSLIHNEGSYSLHGGPHNISHHNWDIENLYTASDYCALTFCTCQENGIDGFPGNRTYHVTYTVTENSELTISYLVTTDQDTYLNLTNHTYWNLTGRPQDALSQILSIHADKVCINAPDHFPLYLKDNFNSQDMVFMQNNFSLCFQNGISIQDFLSYMQSCYATKKDLSLEDKQFVFSKGLNHGFLFTTEKISALSSVSQVCTLKDPKNGYSLLLSTDAPGIVVYTGGFMESNHPLEQGELSCPSCGIALEVQELPTVSPYHITTPANPYRRTIHYQFCFDNTISFS